MNFSLFSLREIKAGFQIVYLYLSYISGYRIIPRPVILHWILTYSCNCKCSYCGRGNFKSQRKILHKKQAFSLLDQAKQLGVKYIAFTGGEPMLHDFLLLLASYAKKNGFGTILNTNGLLISKDNYKLLIKFFDYIVISIDTLNPKEFDKLRGIQNGLPIVMDSIDLLIKNIPERRLFINILVHGKNYKNLIPVIKHFSNKKIPVLMQPLHKSEEAKLFVEDETLLNLFDIDEVWDKVLNTIEYTDNVRKLTIREYYQNFPVFFNNPKKLKKSFTCFAGSFSFFSNPYGDIFTCEEKPDVIGNICTSPLKDIWINMHDLRKQITSNERNCICWYQCSALNYLFLTRLFSNYFWALFKKI